MEHLMASLDCLLQRKTELETELRAINLMIDRWYSAKDIPSLKKGPGRPKGSKNPDSLDSIILTALEKARDGLTFSAIMIFVLNSGYKSSASSSVFRSMLKSRLSCLKSQGFIEKCENQLTFKLI